MSNFSFFFLLLLSSRPPRAARNTFAKQLMYRKKFVYTRKKMRHICFIFLSLSSLLQLDIYFSAREKLGKIRGKSEAQMIFRRSFSSFPFHPVVCEEKNANYFVFVPLSRLSRNSAASRRTAILIFTHRNFLYLFTLEKFLLSASKWLFRFTFFCVVRWILCQEFFAFSFRFFLCNKYLFAKFSKYKLDFFCFSFFFVTKYT